MTFYYAILSALAMSLISLSGVILLKSSRDFQKLLLMISAVILVQDALLHLLPESVERGILTYSQILLLFTVGAGTTCAVSILFKGYANLVNEGLHNFVDGLGLGLAWMVSPEVGLSTFLSVAAHELPQEMGELAILAADHTHLTTAQLLLLNLTVSLTCLLGVLVAFAAGPDSAQGFRDLMLPITAGAFLTFGLFMLAPLVVKERRILQFMAVTAAFAAMHFYHEH